MRLNLYLAIGAVKAERRLDDHWSKLTPDAVYELAFLAYGDVKTAEEMRCKKIEQLNAEDEARACTGKLIS